MLTSKGFDLWAGGYDKSVSLSDDSNEYPFAGYKDVLNEVYRAVRAQKGLRVLDIGFGTGVLTKKLYDDGYEITGLDFSEKMIRIAREKMPGAVLLRHDFSKGLPEELLGRQFDCIVSTYALHHLSDGAKLGFISDLCQHLSPEGILLIGDIAFESRARMNECRKDAGDEWDEDEAYFVFDEIARQIPARKIGYRQISRCAGVLTIRK